MDLKQEIICRKSIRKYQTTKLNKSELDTILEAVKSFPKLSDVKLSFRIVNETKGPYHIKTLHFLIISGDITALVDENAGYGGHN